MISAASRVLAAYITNRAGKKFWLVAYIDAIRADRGSCKGHPAPASNTPPKERRTITMAINNYAFVTDAAQFRFIPQGDSRPAFVYADGKRTDTQKVNAEGQPLESVAALALLPNGEQGEVRISVPAHIDAKSLGFGGQLIGQGKALVTIRGAQDGFGLSLSVELQGYAPAK